jgi:hypothetical protein
LRGSGLTATPVALFTGGAPGAGKTALLDLVLPGTSLVSLDADRILDELTTSPGDDRDALLPDAFAMLETRQATLIAASQNLVVNTTAADLAFVTELRARLVANGYRTIMAFVVAPLDLALARNSARPWPLAEASVRRKHAQADGNRDALNRLFAPFYLEFDNGAGPDRLAEAAESVRLMLAACGRPPASPPSAR